MTTPSKHEMIRQSYLELISVRNKIMDFEQDMADELSFVASKNLVHARNLIHYTGLKRQDITSLQPGLLALGLNPLDHPESNVLGTIDAVLGALTPIAEPLPAFNPSGVTFEAHSTTDTAIVMATLPPEAAHNYQVSLHLLDAGMNIARILSSRDDQHAWEKMIHNLRRASADSKKKCLIMLDLDSTIRIGEFRHHNPAIKIEPERNEKGQVVRNAVVRFVLPGHQPKPGIPEIPIEKVNYHLLKNNDSIYLRDSAERSRRMQITDVKKDYIEAETDKTIYLDSGIRIMFLRKSEIIDHANIGKLPSVEMQLTVFKGDELIITPPGSLGQPAIRNDKGQILQPASISCTCPELFTSVNPGERIFFNNGKLEGMIRKVKESEIQVKITQSGKMGNQLCCGQHLFFPDSNLHLPVLTPTVWQNLEFAAQHADLIGLSSSYTSGDLKLIHELMNEKSAKKIGVILKVETLSDLKNLPQLMLAGMQNDLFGVLVHPQKLAIGLQTERLGEIQTQLSNWCKAARIPVVQNNRNLTGPIGPSSCNDQ